MVESDLGDPVTSNDNGRVKHPQIEYCLVMAGKSDIHISSYKVSDNINNSYSSSSHQATTYKHVWYHSESNSNIQHSNDNIFATSFSASHPGDHSSSTLTAPIASNGPLLDGNDEVCLTNCNV